jgi:CRP/FNR family transcriptional regulator
MAGTASRRRLLCDEQVLYAQGDRFENLYAVRSGTLKSTMALADGRAQVLAFHMAGEVVAWDGMCHGAHTTTVTALDSAQVCVIGCASLHAAAGLDSGLQRRLNHLMGQEIVRSQGMAMMLGVCSARERLAGFLLDLSGRFQAQGYSARDFMLRMTRADIGSYLGMTLETVSRTFSLLRNEGLLQVDHRRVRIQDPDRLRRCCERPEAACRD